MSEVGLIFPHQLFESISFPAGLERIYLVEDFLFFKQYAFHKQKLVFHRASMKFYESYLESRGMEVSYIESANPKADIRKLLPMLAEQGVGQIHYVDPVDDWLEKRIRQGLRNTDIEGRKYDSPGFLNTHKQLESFFLPPQSSYFQTRFYIQQRKQLDILLDDDSSPKGGKWSFDADNRKKYPKGKVPPKVALPEHNSLYEEARQYTEANFPNNPGTIAEQPFYPGTFTDSQNWLQQFLQNRFEEFGPYEDAIVRDEHFLHHSVLTPMLNVGLLTPDAILESTLAFTQKHEIPINSLEGFIRQIIGWREFIRGMYMFRGTEERIRNFWNFNRKIPKSFYEGTTGIEPVDTTIRKVLKTAYCHHIERLMVLGNFMLLCEFDPDEVYKWFMELFIDAYDWVMVPNVYGMSQFADGGLMATKPYISGSNYLRKMSDYPKGDWQQIWDALFWRFMHVHRDFFSQNPRLGMLLGTFDKMKTEKRKTLLETAEHYLKQLDESV